jgi:IS5 family transposase
MRPKQPKVEPQEDLFRARLENLVDRRHPLVRMAALIDWGRFEAEFGLLYTDGGRLACCRFGGHLDKVFTGSIRSIAGRLHIDGCGSRRPAWQMRAAYRQSSRRQAIS